MHSSGTPASHLQGVVRWGVTGVLLASAGLLGCDDGDTSSSVTEAPTTLTEMTVEGQSEASGEVRDRFAAAQQEAVVYAFGDKSIIEHYDDLKPVTVRVDSSFGRSERLAAVLNASTNVEGNARPALTSSAIPAVSVDGSVVVLNWDSEAASSELAIWSTSSGSTGLNLVLGMMFDNDPEVEVVEMRMDGSCQLFTETMQGAGCQTFSRERWTQFRTG